LRAAAINAAQRTVYRARQRFRLQRLRGFPKRFVHAKAHGELHLRTSGLFLKSLNFLSIQIFDFQDTRSGLPAATD
jgi:hypothetical protein